MISHHKHEVTVAPRLAYHNLTEEEEQEERISAFTHEPCRLQSEFALPSSWLNTTESTGKNYDPFDFSGHGITYKKTQKTETIQTYS